MNIVKASVVPEDLMGRASIQRTVADVRSSRRALCRSGLWLPETASGLPAGRRPNLAGAVQNAMMSKQRHMIAVGKAAGGTDQPLRL